MTDKNMEASQNPIYCRFCNSSQVTQLPSPCQQSMRSDGLILSEPLLKFNCLNCGTILGKNSQSERKYQRSNGNSRFCLDRHKKVATGLLTCFESLSKKIDLKIIEIGAANFYTSLTLKNLKPSYEITALERHPENIPITHDIEIVEEDFFKYQPNRKFDLCFSNQVIEHFDDPILFLTEAKKLINEGGFLVACCPTFAVASNELLFTDHITHFTHDTMAICASKAGLELANESVSEWDPLTHVYTFRHLKATKNKGSLFSNHESLIQARKNLLSAWRDEDAKISKSLSNYQSINIYGAGEFTQLIRAYLPKIWARVDKILVDDLNGARTFDKPVIDFNNIKINSTESFIIGSHKQSHDAIFNKLINKGISGNNIFKFSV
jgi:SAM-dependent methyltransferase